MTTYEVRIRAEHELTFMVDADSAAEAAKSAMASLWEGATPETREVVNTEVSKVVAGDHEIDLTWVIDLLGPKNGLGLSPWCVVAYVDGKRVTDGHDLSRVLDAAESGFVAASDTTEGTT